jgi:hypothetical protein
MRFQANPDGTILPQNDIELCEARGGLLACWTILRSDIKVNNVQSIQSWKKNFVVESKGGHDSQNPLDPRLLTPVGDISRCIDATKD